MYAEVKLIAKMAAAVRQIGRWRPIFNGPIFLQIRTATKRQRQLEEHKRNDDVFLLNYRTSPSHTFTDAMNALRAYAINGERQTVELQMKINMGENKVNHSCGKSFLSANDSDQREFFCFLQTKVNPFHGMMVLPKPYGKERKLLVFAKVLHRNLCIAIFDSDSYNCRHHVVVIIIIVVVFIALIIINVIFIVITC